VRSDADEAFFDWVRRELPGDADVLEVGAGSGERHAHGLRTVSRRVTGIDLDPKVLSNPELTRALLVDYRSMPFPDASFDAVIANNVVEHLDDPVSLIVASIRVLRRNGAIYIKTPNLDHYVGVASRLTPHAFHVSFNSARGRPPSDTHRTLYRLNTARAVRRCAERTGLDVEVRTFEGLPEYLVGNSALFLAGVLYERAVNSMPPLHRFRCVLMARLRRR
jgi:SAM-dependent methyltransferase